MPTTLKLDTSQSGTLVLTLDRPECLNAINEVMVAELENVLATIGRDHAVRVVVLTGAGRGFCAGLDLRSFGASMPDADDPAIDVLRFQEMMASLPQALRALPQPVIAAVNGPAVGAGLASQIVANSPLGVSMTKRALQVNTDAPDLFAAVELENRNQVITLATEESVQERAKWSK